MVQLCLGLTTISVRTSNPPHRELGLAWCCPSWTEIGLVWAWQKLCYINISGATFVNKMFGNIQVKIKKNQKNSSEKLAWGIFKSFEYAEMWHDQLKSLKTVSLTQVLGLVVPLFHRWILALWNRMLDFGVGAVKSFFGMTTFHNPVYGRSNCASLSPYTKKIYSKKEVYLETGCYVLQILQLMIF